MRFTSILTLGLTTQALASRACKTDEDCSLNGVCRPEWSWPWSTRPTNLNLWFSRDCDCGSGWFGSNCGSLDLRPVNQDNGYNHSADAVDPSHPGPHGNSSRGGQILQDSHNPGLFHLFASQFANGCGLSGWRPHSFIMRAESRSRPQGPYYFADSVRETFWHNPYVFWSPADRKYLLYSIGVDDDAPQRENCRSINYTQWPNNISVASAEDIRGPWSPFEMILDSKEPHSANPSPWPLWTSKHRTSQIILGVEDNAIFMADKYNGEYLLRWPRVGARIFARELAGPWHFHQHEAFNSTVHYTDGSNQTLKRRERAKLFFSTDEEMTPLYMTMTTGVQEMVAGSASSTLIQPIGVKWREYERSLGF
ncbi:hypothetical protein BDW59DRAFT_182318 [Aspergillus cavernicola]|uniref:EGF-like domain-containing protein n=1 Tax=Aspergillus cavernicola TaxID=176166 RepID=A0ABR4HR63_9EURO